MIAFIVFEIPIWLILISILVGGQLINDIVQWISVHYILVCIFIFAYCALFVVFETKWFWSDAKSKAISLPVLVLSNLIRIAFAVAYIVILLLDVTTSYEQMNFFETILYALGLLVFSIPLCTVGVFERVTIDAIYDSSNFEIVFGAILSSLGPILGMIYYYLS